MVKVYLSGAMAGCTMQEMTGWRNAVKRALPNIFCYDPTDRVYGKTHFNPDEIVIQDKKQIEDSDILFLNVPDKERMSWGSAMEVYFAWERRKHVIVVWQPNIIVSAWVEYHANKVVKTLSEGVQAIREYYEYTG